MENAGVWNQRYDEIDDLQRARRLPSPQLVGTPERSTLDLNALAAGGVELVGRLSAIRDGRALFSGGLRNLFALADLKMERLLDTFDEWRAQRRVRRECRPRQRFEPTRVPAKSPLELDLNDGAIRSVVWARAFGPIRLAARARRRSQRALAARRRRHRRRARTLRDRPAGVAAAQVDVHRGAEDDARDVVAHLAGYLDRASRR
jgi:putative flavoprotein involved in K+ transport